MAVAVTAHWLDLKSASLELGRDGAQLFAGLLGEEALASVERAFEAQEAKPSVRLYSGLRDFRSFLGLRGPSAI